MSKFIIGGDPKCAVRTSSRKQQGINYVALVDDMEFQFTDEATCREIAKRVCWMFAARTECFCVQDGVIGGRPFESFEHTP